MDFDLDRASKRLQKERERREREAKRKAAIRKRREELARKERERIEAKGKISLPASASALLPVLSERAKDVSKIKYKKVLKAFPLPDADTDRLKLPQSALEEIMKDGSVDAKVLTFQISIAMGSSFGLKQQFVTHAGVSEFTAEEGFVGVPPKVARCLRLSKENVKLSICCVELPHYKESSVTLQPRNKGFHAEGEDSVSIDLKSILHRTLMRQVTLTQGDLIQLRHNGRTYELVARKVEPEPCVLLLNTDLEVKLMPSEEAERQEKARLEKENWRKDAIAKAEEVSKNLGPESGDVKISLRMRSASGHKRAFRKEEKFKSVLRWVESLVALTLPQEDQEKIFRGEYKLVQSWPGHRLCFERADSEKSLKEMGLVSRMERLICELDGESSAPTKDMDRQNSSSKKAEEEIDGSQNVTLWDKSEKLAVEKLDEEIKMQVDTNVENEVEPEKHISAEERVEIFNYLLRSGITNVLAAKLAQHYSAEILQLKTMGFVPSIEMSKYLEKYNGRVLRVANALLNVNKSEESHDGDDAMDVQTTPSTHSANPPQVPGPSQMNQEDSSLVRARFSELVASGMNSNEAAIQALNDVKTKKYTQYSHELNELKNMGFSDTQRCLKYLKKYQGRLDRVVNALVTDSN